MVIDTCLGSISFPTSDAPVVRLHLYTVNEVNLRAVGESRAKAAQTQRRSLDWPGGLGGRLGRLGVRRLVSVYVLS